MLHLNFIVTMIEIFYIDQENTQLFSHTLAFQDTLLYGSFS